MSAVLNPQGDGRVPPQSLEAERSTLGSMLIDKDAVPRVFEILEPQDFYREAHRIIYEAILDLHDKNEPVDLVTVTEHLRGRNSLEQVGGIEYITSLANSVPTSANAEYYARIVKEKALTRSLISVGTQIANLGYESSQDIEVALDEAERLVFALAQRRNESSVVGMKDILITTFERIEQLYETRGKVTGVPTGFKDLDEMLSGLQPSDLIVIAARPSMGKTSLALNIAEHVAIRERIPVAVFSLEMSREQLAMRMLSSQARVNSQHLRRGDIADEDWRKLADGLGLLSEAPIFIDDTPSITALEIRAKCRRLKAEHGLGLVLIDYLQLIQGRGRAENRQQEIAEITRSLKALARELKVPVVALAQLSRAVETAAERRPMLSHLKESGEIEASADVVMFIYREDYYAPKTEKENIAEIIIAKQRNGPTGSVELMWHKEYTRFENYYKERKTSPVRQKAGSA